MINRAFVEVAGAKPGGGQAATRGRWSFRLAFFAAAVAAVLFPFTTNAQGIGKQLLHGHVPPALADLSPQGRLPATNELRLSIALPLRNQEVLTNLLRELYDPASPNYHHYLTSQQFAEQFGPSESDYAAVMAFARTNGLAVTGTFPNRTLLDVSGTVADIEKTFHVTLRIYPHPLEARSFFAPDVEPSVNLSVPVLHITGLDNFEVPRPAFKIRPLDKQRPFAANTGSGPSGNFSGYDFRKAYAPGVTLTGTGQTVALVEMDGYHASDITYYENLNGLPNVTVTNILLGGFAGNPVNGGQLEVCLDIEMAIDMAPGLSQVMVYEAPLTSVGAYDILNQMATDNQAKQISSSWVIDRIVTTPVPNSIYLQYASQGQSFFQACGDDDSYGPGIYQTADNPYIITVGGTTLTTTGAGGSYSSEIVWQWGGGSGTGGGISTNFAIPSYQVGINMTTNQGSTTMRNVPDVALTADNIYVRAGGADNTGVGGTSCAAPLWAGFTALINQQAIAAGRTNVGFINPAVYALAQTTDYASCFHDIVVGNNTNSVNPTRYYAVPGYDLCTGWGTPNGQNLINALAGPLDTLGIVPPNGFNASGPAGGPFNPSSQIFFLTNTSASPLTWSLINTSAWLNASATSGTLAAGATNGVTISLAAAANSLAMGTYAATVQLTNWNTHVAQYLQFTLQALQPLVVTPASGFVSSGPVGGPFSVTSQNFSLTNSGPASLNWSLINTSAWLTASGGGTLAAGASTTATVALSSTATNLATGTYTANIWFTNQTGGGAQARQFNLLVNQSLIQNGGFETGDFTGWTLNGDGYNYNYVDNSSTVTYITAHSGTYFAALGESGFLAYLSQNIPTFAGQSYLLSMWLENPPSSPYVNKPNAFVVQWNGNTLFDSTNMNRFAWSNLQFIVTATTSSSILNIGAQDNNYWLGLDDVNLVPIPAAKFQPTPVTKTNNNLKFTWNAMTGLVYQVQYNTNLLKTNWVALKSITATNTPITFVDTNPITGSPQKFYRLLLLP